jgi:hypothetical protein
MRIATAILTFVSCAHGADLSSAPGAPVHICIEGSPHIPFVMTRAIKLAKGMFQEIGVQTEWQYQSRRCMTAWEAPILVQVIAEVPAARLPDALAVTALGGDRRIEVFYNRITAVTGPLGVAGVMAHVLAHEVTHALEGVPRHSEEGVMKAHGDWRDFKEMSFRTLPFEGTDVQLMAMRTRP